MKKIKSEELREMKKELKNRKYALKFEDKYRTIKFFGILTSTPLVLPLFSLEKRKTLRRISKLEKSLESFPGPEEEKEQTTQELHKYQNNLIYINVPYIRSSEYLISSRISLGN